MAKKSGRNKLIEAFVEYGPESLAVIAAYELEKRAEKCAPVDKAGYELLAKKLREAAEELK